MRVIPGTHKVGVFGFCWGCQYAVLQARGRKIAEDGSSSVGGADAVVVCHPSLLAIPGDFEDVNRPISLAVGTKDSMLDMDGVGKIREVLEGPKKDVPHECEGICRVDVVHVEKHTDESDVQFYEDQVHGFALRGD